eukprot:symbB.v1.2.011353.t1/scaffold745.1/size165919/10
MSCCSVRIPYDQLRLSPCDQCGYEGQQDTEAEALHVSKFLDLCKKFSEGISSPDSLVAIAETASEHLASKHWLLCKVRYFLSCFYEKHQRPSLAVENLQSILDLEQRALGRISPEKLEQKGDQLMMKGDLPQAFECYAQVLKALKKQSPDLLPGSSRRCEEMRQKLRAVLDAKITSEGYPG